MNRIKELKPPFSYDDYGQSVINADGHKVLDVRGWGFIQYLENPEELQDSFGELIVEFLNKKAEDET